MARDELRKRIAEMNKRPMKNVPAEENSEMGGLRRKLRKQAEAKVAKLAEDKVIFPMSEAPMREAPFDKLRMLPESPQPIVFSRNTPSGRIAPPRFGVVQPRDFGPPIALEEAVRGIVTAAPEGPGYYHIELPATELDPCAFDMHCCFVPLLGHPAGEAAERVAAACKAERLCPEEVLFLDLETTGLSMTPVFLIGTMECTCDSFVFRQYLARDYSEEASILSAFSHRLGEARMVVTFNGKSFDVPYLKSRAVATGVKLPHPRSHLDLLHESRRHFGRRTPNHKLQTLERIICGKCREDDIPGEEIPAAYHEFVRTGNARKIGMILEHNLHDLLTMADLMGKMWGRQD